MQIFLLYLFLFLVGCMIGWGIELLFRRFFTAKKWVNPGFMKGPWLPLYGFGVVLMFSVCYVCVGRFPEKLRFYNPFGDLFGRAGASGPAVADLIPILMMWLGMVVLEFVAGVIFIKGFRVKLWDYSNMKGNVMGVICPVFSAIWLAVAALFYYAVDPALYRLSARAYNYMFGAGGQVAHFGFLFLLGLGYGLMIYDFATSVGMLRAISRFARESGLSERYELLRQKWNENLRQAKQKLGLDKLKLPETGTAALKDKIAEAIYIDPEKEKTKPSNYDENGRPVREDEPEDKNGKTV